MKRREETKRTKKEPEFQSIQFLHKLLLFVFFVSWWFHFLTVYSLSNRILGSAAIPIFLQCFVDLTSGNPVEHFGQCRVQSQGWRRRSCEIFFVFVNNL